jgi:solute carrier family 35, member C2
MVKSSSLVFVLFFAFLFKLETFSLRLVGVVMLIVAGVLLMVATETHFVLGGFILVLSASALGGLRWALTQRLLRSKDMGLENPAATLFWLTPVMATFLFFLSVVVERWWAMFDSKFFDGVGATLHTVFFLGAPGVIAFCMVLSEF